jgi:hypothetical protein
VDRLIEHGGSTEAESQLVDLIASCEPVSVSDLGKKRSLGVVYHRHHERRRSAQLATRLALTAGVLLVAGAATAAAFGVRWRAQPEPSPPVVLATAPAHHHAARAQLAPISEEAPATEIAAAPEPPVRHARAVRSQARSQARPDVQSEDPSLVVSAIQALRQDQDPARASRLLAAYLRTHRDGALVEEAVALSFEAADARKSPAAAGFAQRYLRDYPQGRFRAAAERLLARPTP